MIQTLAGGIEETLLGKTLMHEHVFNRFPIGFKDRNTAYTLQLLRRCKDSGIDTVVDLTPYTSIGSFDDVIENSPVNILGCIGFYLERYMTPDIRGADYQQLLLRMSRKIEKGFGKKKYKPGIIKVACSGDSMSPFEKKSMLVAAKLNQEYGLPIAVHSPEGTLMHYGYLVEMGADPHKIVMSHSEFKLSECSFHEKVSEAEKVIDSGGYILLSKFGTTTSGKRSKRSIEYITELKRQGLIDHLLVSSDCNWKWRGGEPRLQNGSIVDYSYAVEYICPLLVANGFSEEDVSIMMKNNPRKILGRNEA
ncbi:MAG: hypothetical protein IKX68_09560 [Clostridiales bacterium]|nr:hypothetical protein [Clostridiales bacterium]